MKVLIAIDGSSAALDGVHWALRQAADGLALEVVLLNVQEPASLYEVVTAHDTEVIDAVRRSAGADLLLRAEALLQAAGRDFESEVAGGVPQHLITELAENYGCDAIVVGARGLGSPESAGLGSVALGVLTEATVPVVVVRPAAADLAESGEPADDADAAAP